MLEACKLSLRNPGLRAGAPHRRSRCCVREERRLRRINNTPQGEATEGNSPEANKRSSLDPALRGDDSLMVDQGESSESRGKFKE